MLDFLQNLKARNEALYYFGLICFVFSLLFLVLSKYSSTQVLNINAWYKPFKFAFSIFLYSWTMAWYCHYLADFNIKVFNITVIVLLGFEIAYIAFQASKGEMSHFNLTTKTYAALYSAMGRF